MTARLEESSLINGYNIDTALAFLGPVDLVPEERGSLDCICFLITNIWMAIKRVFHFIFSCDHQWYNNETARNIIRYYVDHYEENRAILPKVVQLYNDLRTRGLYPDCCGGNYGFPCTSGLLNPSGREFLGVNREGIAEVRNSLTRYL
jgi:hypothetical protein